MRSHQKNTFGYSVSKSSLPTISESDESGLMFSFTEENVPQLKTVTFFGAMTKDECKMLALLISNGRSFKMAVPRDVDHTEWHGDTLTLTREELEDHLRHFFGEMHRFPRGTILSMEKFLEYLRDEVLPELKSLKKRK